MSWCNRRKLLISLGAFAGLAACGFSPAYGPNGGARQLQGAIALAEPDSRTDYLLNQRLEERLGRVAAPVYALTTKVSISDDGLGTSSDGQTTRFNLTGKVVFELAQIGTETPVVSGDTSAFTGYSTTGSTVATLAAARDAETRLMIILADQIVDRLILSAQSLPDTQ